MQPTLSGPTTATKSEATGAERAPDARVDSARSDPDGHDERPPASGTALLRNFAIGSLLIFVLVGVLLYALINADNLRQIKERASDDAELISVALTGSGAVEPSWLEGGIPTEELASLMPIANALDISDQVWEAITLYNAEGDVVISTDLALLGQTIPLNSARQEALRGEAAQQVLGRDEIAVPNLTEGTKIVTDVPFDLDGETVGVLEVVQAIDAERSAAQSRLFTQLAILGGGLLLIYLALLPVVARAARAQRQAAKKTTELLERERETVERLRELDKAKDDLLAFSAHEFRTPLTSLLGFAQTLEVHRHSLSDEQIDDYLQTVLRQARRLQRVADDFLDAAAIEAGRLDVDPEVLSAAGVANEVVGEFPDVDLQCEVDGSPSVVADKTRLEQILTNLIRNAFFHGPKDGRVTLRVHPEANGMCAFDVSDEGSGLDADSVERLFSKFERGEGRSRGSGLGLYISRHLSEALGGSLALVEDAPTTTFRVRIPLASRTGSRPEPSPADEPIVQEPAPH